MSADRHSRLQEAFQHAYEAGEELQKALREPVTPALVDHINELVDHRDRAVQVAVSLFQPGDQARFHKQLQALTQQQQVLDAEMRRWVEGLKKVVRAAGQAKFTVRGARQMISDAGRGRMIDEKR